MLSLHVLALYFFSLLSIDRLAFIKLIAIEFLKQTTWRNL